MSLITLGLGGPPGGLITLGYGSGPGGSTPTPPAAPGEGTGGTFFVAGGGGVSSLITLGLGSPGGLVTLGYGGSGSGSGGYVETDIKDTSIILDDGSELDLMGVSEGTAVWVPLGGGLWNLDGHTSFMFAQVGGDNTTEYPAETPIRVQIGPVIVFRGKIATVVPQWSEFGWQKIYTAHSPEYWATRIPVTNAQNGTGRYVFNVQDPLDEDYIFEDTDRTVGQILTRMFDDHADALEAEGILGYDPDQFTSMDVVPRQPITFEGMNLFTQLRDFQAQWAGDHAMTVWLDGMIVAKKWADFSDLPYDLHADPGTGRPSLSRDPNNCYTAVVCRGRANIKTATLHLAKDDLEEAWDPADEAVWKMLNAAGSSPTLDTGVVTASTFTTVTINPDDNAKVWDAGDLQEAHGEILLRKPLGGTGGLIDLFESRKVIGNTALTAGGTSVLTLDYPLPTDTGWTDYRLNGFDPGSAVYQDYHVVYPEIGEHLVQTSRRGMPASTSSHMIGLINSARGWVRKGEVEVPLEVLVNPSTGIIRFRQPTVVPYNTPSRLRTGNPGLVKPDDVSVSVFFSMGAVSVREPTSGFEGTGFDEDGIQRVLYHDLPDWDYEGDKEVYRKLARMLLETTKDIVREGTCTHEGIREDVIGAGPFLNLSVCATGDGGWTTGLEDTPMAIRQYTISYEEGAPFPIRSEMAVSNRRRFSTAPAAFVPLQAALFAHGGVFGSYSYYGAYGGGQDGPLIGVHGGIMVGGNMADRSPDDDYGVSPDQYGGQDFAGLSPSSWPPFQQAAQGRYDPRAAGQKQAADYQAAHQNALDAKAARVFDNPFEGSEMAPAPERAPGRESLLRPDRGGGPEGSGVTEGRASSVRYDESLGPLPEMQADDPAKGSNPELPQPPPGWRPPTFDE